MSIHAVAMGDFTDGVPYDPYIEYDLCECGQIKQAGSPFCLTCAAQRRAEARNREQAAKDEAMRRTAHAFYRSKMAEGWTLAQVIDYIQVKRTEDSVLEALAWWAEMQSEADAEDPEVKADWA